MLGRSSSCALTRYSMPAFCMPPMFVWKDGTPADGATGCENNASFVRLMYQVNSPVTRSFNQRESKPPSNSDERSGLRSGLPVDESVRAVPVTPEAFAGPLE